MADPDYLLFVWNHVLRGARLISVASVRRGFVLTFQCPEGDDGEVYRLELHTPGPLEAAWPEGGAPVLIHELLESNALFVPPPEAVLGLWLAGDPGGPGAVRLCYDGGLASLTTAAGAKLSQMAAFRLGKASVLAHRGLVDTPALVARRSEALASVAPIVAASGFRWSEALSWRADPEVTQAIATVHSRWNTYVSLSFRFDLHAVVAPPPTRAPRSALHLYAPPVAGPAHIRPGHTLRSPCEDYTVDQHTRPEALAATLIDDFERYYLPFLERVRDPDGVRRAIAARP